MSLVKDNLREDKIEEQLIATAIRKHEFEDEGKFKHAKKMRKHFDRLLLNLIKT